MFDGHEDLFFFKRQISFVDERIHSEKGSEPGPEHKWKTFCLDTGCACDQNEGRVCHKKSHYSNLEIVFEKSVYLVTLALVFIVQCNYYVS